MFDQESYKRQMARAENHQFTRRVLLFGIFCDVIIIAFVMTLVLGG